MLIVWLCLYCSNGNYGKPAAMLETGLANRPKRREPGAHLSKNGNGDTITMIMTVMIVVMMMVVAMTIAMTTTSLYKIRQHNHHG